MKLDAKDFEILRALQSDSRMPFQNIAKRVGVSDATVYNRIQKMRKSGLIRKFTVDIDEKKLGFDVVVCMGFNINARDAEKVVEKLRESEHIYELWTTTGAHNMTGRAVFRNLAEIQEFTKWVNSIHGMNNFDFAMVVNESKTIPRVDAKKLGAMCSSARKQKVLQRKK